MFDTLVVFESYPIDKSGLSAASSIDGMSVLGVDTKDATHYPLTMVVVADAEITFTLKYRADLVDADAAESMTTRFARVLDSSPTHRMEPTQPGPSTFSMVPSGRRCCRPGTV